VAPCQARGARCTSKQRATTTAAPTRTAGTRLYWLCCCLPRPSAHRHRQPARHACARTHPRAVARTYPSLCHMARLGTWAHAGSAGRSPPPDFLASLAQKLCEARGHYSWVPRAPCPRSTSTHPITHRQEDRLGARHVLVGCQRAWLILEHVPAHRFASAISEPLAPCSWLWGPRAWLPSHPSSPLFSCPALPLSSHQTSSSPSPLLALHRPLR
jgi:hypothetical protein